MKPADQAQQHERQRARGIPPGRRCVRGILMTALVTCAAPPLLAHGDGVAGTSAAPWWLQWHLDPLIVSSLAWMAGLYTIGWRRRHQPGSRPTLLRGWRAGAFAAGMLALVLALLSPIDVFAGELLSVHMIQHMVLMNVAAPLVMLGAPGRVIWRALSDRPRLGWAQLSRTTGRFGWPRHLLWQPLVLWLLYAALLWLWHLPAAYEAALADRWVHDLQHLGFFGAAALFWRVLFDPLGRVRLGRLPAIVYLFTTSLHATILGVFMALAPRIWYPTYATNAAALSSNSLHDQQLAGYIMWMPACMTYAIVAAAMVATSLARPKRHWGEASRQSA